MDDDESSQADAQSHLSLTNDSCMFLLCEEVQEIVNSNSTALELFGREKAELLNYIISLQNVLNTQEVDNRRLQVMAQAQQEKVADIKVKQSSLREVLLARYSECCKNFDKVVKEIESVEGIKKAYRRRASHTGQICSPGVSKSTLVEIGQSQGSEVQEIEGQVSDFDSNDEKESNREIEAQLNRQSISNFETIKSSSTKRLNKVKVVIAERELDEEDQDTRPLMERAISLRDEMKKLRDLLNLVNERINAFKLGIESKLNEPVTCKNCYRKYTMLNNPAESCRYHPGKVNYFSCKVCGGDEYYTCCRVCKACNPGCQVGQHVPVIRYSEFKS